jgi:hypothetical protein
MSQFSHTHMIRNIYNIHVQYLRDDRVEPAAILSPILPPRPPQPQRIKSIHVLEPVALGSRITAQRLSWQPPRVRLTQGRVHTALATLHARGGTGARVVSVVESPPQRSRVPLVGAPHSTLVDAAGPSARTPAPHTHV